MKRWISFLIFCISFCLLLASLLRHPQRLSSYAVSEERIDELMAERTSTWDMLVKEISFNDTPLMYDEKGDRWFYSAADAPERDDPFVKWEYQGGIGRVHVVFDGIRLLMYTDREYHLYELVTTTLPLMRIEYEEKISFLEDIPMHMTLLDNRPEAARHFITSEGKIHLRGNSTSIFPKLSYRFSLRTESDNGSIRGNDIPLLGMRKDDDWILYAGYNDQEKVRNVFSSNLWFESCAENNRWKLENGDEYRYVELFINHDYHGLYALGYPIDGVQLQLNEREVSVKKNGWPETDLYYILQTPDTPEAWDLIHDYNEKILAADPAVMRSYADPDNAADLYLFLMLIQGEDHVKPDGRIKNLFLTFKEENGSRRLLYTPWDMDITWGNGWSSEVKNHSLEYLYDSADNSFRMLRNPALILAESGDENAARMIENRYNALRKDAWSDERIDRMLDDLEAQIFGSGAYLRDMELWPDGNYIEPETGLTRFRDYVHGRLSAMDELFGIIDL